MDTISGLDRLPTFLADTMLPNISPDVAAEASVLANGGLDSCEYVVSNDTTQLSIQALI